MWGKPASSYEPNPHRGLPTSDLKSIRPHGPKGGSSASALRRCSASRHSQHHEATGLRCVQRTSTTFMGLLGAERASSMDVRALVACAALDGPMRIESRETTSVAVLSGRPRACATFRTESLRPSILRESVTMQDSLMSCPRTCIGRRRSVAYLLQARREPTWERNLTLGTGFHRRAIVPNSRQRSGD